MRGRTGSVGRQMRGSQHAVASAAVLAGSCGVLSMLSHHRWHVVPYALVLRGGAATFTMPMGTADGKRGRGGRGGLGWKGKTGPPWEQDKVACNWFAAGMNSRTPLPMYK